MCSAHIFLARNPGGGSMPPLPGFFASYGYNGRLDKKSTGIGLYLCKEISRRLSHTLTIESEPGKGTRVTIDFATRQLQAE